MSSLKRIEEMLLPQSRFGAAEIFTNEPEDDDEDDFDDEFTEPVYFNSKESKHVTRCNYNPL